MKPSTALVPGEKPSCRPSGRGSGHHEVEVAVLIGQELRQTDLTTARQAVAGYAIALDLNFRDVQDELKAKGLPWERAKAFDGACPLSRFMAPERLPDPQNSVLSLSINGAVRQQGNTAQMMMGILEFNSLRTKSISSIPEK